MISPTLNIHHFWNHQTEHESPQQKARFMDKNVMNEIGSKLNELGPGEAFGEKALLATDLDHAKRSATIVALTDVEFMIIKKAEFEKIVQRFSIQNEIKMEFLTKIMPFLKSIRSISTLENLVYSFKEETIGMNMTVTEENQYDPNEKIYVLFEGLCRVEKHFEFTINGIQHSLECRICDLVEGSLIGEEIIFKDINTKNLGSGLDESEPQQIKYSYYYTVVVISERAKFYVINKANFLMKFPKEIRAFLWSQFKIKEKSRKELFHKNSQEILKNFQEDQFQILIQANFLKNHDLLNTMNSNMKRNYIDKIKGFAEELTKDSDFRHKTVHISEEKEEEPYSIIDSLKNQAKYREIMRNKGEISFEMPNDPYELENYLKSNENKYLIRSNTVRSQPKTSLYTDNFESAPKTVPFSKTQQCFFEKLDFGNAIEDEKMEKMRRIKLGILKPEIPNFFHFDVINNLKTKKQKSEEKSIKRTGSYDMSTVRITKNVYNGNQIDQLFSERKISTESRGNSIHEVKKGRVLCKFTGKSKKKMIFLGLGMNEEKKRKKKLDFMKN